MASRMGTTTLAAWGETLAMIGSTPSRSWRVRAASIMTSRNFAPSNVRSVLAPCPARPGGALRIAQMRSPMTPSRPNGLSEVRRRGKRTADWQRTGFRQVGTTVTGATGCSWGKRKAAAARSRTAAGACQGAAAGNRKAGRVGPTIALPDASGSAMVGLANPRPTLRKSTSPA